MADTWWKSPFGIRLPCLSCCMFERDNSDFPLLWDSLINDAADSHLLDFPRFLCVALMQCVVQTPCMHLKAFCHFLSCYMDYFSLHTQSQLDHKEIPARCWAAALHFCCMLWWLFQCVIPPDKGYCHTHSTVFTLHFEASPNILRDRSSLTSYTFDFPSKYPLSALKKHLSILGNFLFQSDITHVVNKPTV